MPQQNSIHEKPPTTDADVQPNITTDEFPNKKQKLENSGGQSNGEMEHDPCDKQAKIPGHRRTYPEPSFDIERAIGAKGRASYTVATKLNVIGYTRLKCSDGRVVGNRGAANRFNLDPKRVREWVQNERELRAAKDNEGKASARSLNKGTAPSPRPIEGELSESGVGLANALYYFWPIRFSCEAGCLAASRTRTLLSEYLYR